MKKAQSIEEERASAGDTLAEFKRLCRRHPVIGVTSSFPQEHHHSLPRFMTPLKSCLRDFANTTFAMLPSSPSSVVHLSDLKGRGGIFMIEYLQDFSFS
jgi:hypothetical protein